MVISLLKGLEEAMELRKQFLEEETLKSFFAEEVIEYRGEDTSWLEEWKELVNAIKEKREPLGNGYDGFKAGELAYMVYKERKRRKALIGPSRSQACCLL